ncbi:hypothetical protein NIBR502772_05880 [Pseudarthrobacter sp. NIBRBAC000502772]|uniref:hypothetical protein n=1 Tax=Pseudarthrobacter sp. NIBRBAC000502772 TaxID=2590775 RepID=UPI001130F367|nr:hypothetical protein [Pseudarthrobacter sp. NIBRBAC000502772]QDG65803.1 hypothetical protein NIBR502772_05880 [Pseudarthrobacter sp. NIBRBAC000502772]
MSELPKALRDLMHEQITAAQQDGMRLGSRFGAKTLRDIADGLDGEPNIAPDYIRGMRDAAIFIERFAEDIDRAGDAK